MIVAGIDAGSRAIKVALLDTTGKKVLALGIMDQGINQQKLAEGLLLKTLRQAKLNRKDIRHIVATGYGRNKIDLADTTSTEITCHAKGVLHQHKKARTVIDIGGQDSKVIKIDASGKVHDFMMNDRCAAGTGRFLEIVADRLKIPINRIDRAIKHAHTPCVISSTCVVFAESEIVGLLAQGERPENIIAGIQNSIATRMHAMSGSQLHEPIIFTGGVALIPGMSKAISKALERKITIADNPQFTGAIGASLAACELE